MTKNWKKFTAEKYSQYDPDPGQPINPGINFLKISNLLFMSGNQSGVREAGPPLLRPRAGRHEGGGARRQGQITRRLPGTTFSPNGPVEILPASWIRGSVPKSFPGLESDRKTGLWYRNDKI
jgi:hypothetical protein